MRLPLRQVYGSNTFERDLYDNLRRLLEDFEQRAEQNGHQNGSSASFVNGEEVRSLSSRELAL